MYYICKFSNSISLYDQSKETSRSLDPSEISALKQIFPNLMKDGKMLAAIQVTEINPNRLQYIGSPSPAPIVDKKDKSETLL